VIAVDTNVLVHAHREDSPFAGIDAVNPLIGVPPAGP
jgi:hypothetical protein